MEEMRLRQQINELQQQWDLVSQKLSALTQSMILETRTEEKFRLEHSINDIKAERERLEQELRELEFQLSSPQPEKPLPPPIIEAEGDVVAAEKISRLQAQWKSLSEELSVLEDTKLLKIDPGEMFRLDKQIAVIETEREQVGQQLRDLESQVTGETKESVEVQPFQRIQILQQIFQDWSAEILNDLGFGIRAAKGFKTFIQEAEHLNIRDEQRREIEDLIDDLERHLQRLERTKRDERISGRTHEIEKREAKLRRTLREAGVLIQELSAELLISPKESAQLAQPLPLVERIEITCQGASGFFIDQQHGLTLEISNYGTDTIKQLIVELDSSSEYEIEAPDNKAMVSFADLQARQSVSFSIPIKVLVPGTLPLNLKIGEDAADEFYRPSLYIYSYEDKPYIYGPAIENKANFFGREKELNTIIDEIGRTTGPHRLLIGEQRSGKTSLLYQINNHFKSSSSPVAPVYISLEDMPCPESENNDEIQAFAWVLDRLVYELQRLEILDEDKDYAMELKYAGYFKRHLRTILKEIRNQGRHRLCLLWDEGNRILKVREDFQNVLRSTLNELGKDVRMVLVCSNEFRDYVQESKSSPLKNVFRYTFLQPMDDNDLEQLIVVPAKRFEYEYERQAITSIKKLSGGHPYYCQVLCAESFDAARNENTTGITVDHVEVAKRQVIQSDEVRDKFILGYWNFLKDSQEELQCLKKVTAGESVADVSPGILERLKKRQLIAQVEPQQYVFTAELFATWMKELLHGK